MTDIYCSQRLCIYNQKGQCVRRAIAWEEIAYQICIKKEPFTLDSLPREIPITQKEGK